MKLKIENFALFKDETTFEIAPLTLLIGANSSGKSTFLKALNILLGLGTSQQDPWFIEDGNNYILKDNLFTISLNNGIVMSIGFTVEEKKIIPTGVITYHDESGNYLLSFKQNRGYGVLDHKVADIHCNIFNLKHFLEKKIGLGEFTNNPNPHDDNTIRELLKAFKLESFNEIFTTSITHKYESSNPAYSLIPGLLSEKDFILHVCKYGGYILNTLTKDCFPPDLLEKTFNNSLFSYMFKDTIKAWGPQRQSDMLDVEAIKSQDLPQRIYFKEHSLFPILYEKDNIHWKDTHDYLTNKWLAFFLPSNFTIQSIPIYNSSKDPIGYELTLNEKHLTEWGTGIFRIVKILIKLANLVILHQKTPLYDFLDDDYPVQPKEAKVIQSLLDNAKKLSVSSSNYMKSKNLLLEEPEMNLHPDYQCKLAEVIYEFTQYFDGNLILETHSEYMIRTFQFLMSKKSNSDSDHINIINFGSSSKLGKVKNIRIEKDGSLSDSFFSGFMSQSQELQLQLLRNNRNISSN